MYKKLIDVAKKIVAISKVRAQNQPDGNGSLLSDIVFLNHDNTYDNQLEQLLMDLDLDEIMSLQTIMYLGRDKDYDSSLTSNEIFTNYKKYIESLGIKIKELEVRQMVGKIPLGEYITEGYKILGIDL